MCGLDRLPRLANVQTCCTRWLHGFRSERSIRSVANLTRSDGIEFLSLAEDVAIETEVHAYPLEQANQVLEDLKRGNFTGAAVIQISLLAVS